MTRDPDGALGKPNTHDPLCPVVTHRLRGSWCQCALIASVRAAERERLVLTYGGSVAMAAVKQDTREAVAEKIAAAIEAAKHDLDVTIPGTLKVEGRVYNMTRIDVMLINAIRGLDAAIARRIGGAQ